MKTIRLLLSCVAMSAMVTAVSAAGLCIQGNGGCKDLSTDQVYVRSGDELVDPETGQPVMTIEPFQEHVVTEQDRRDTLRRKVEAVAEAKAAAQRQRVEAANQRAWAAQAQAEAQAQDVARMRDQTQQQARTLQRMQDDMDTLEAITYSRVR